MLIYLELIEAEGDKAKFEQIYERYLKTMYRTAFAVLENNEDAEDAIQDALLSIAKNIGKISDVYCPETRCYIVIITERKAIDIYRKRRPNAPFQDELYGIDIPMPEDSGLAGAMAKLPAQYREVLLLHYGNGYSTRDLAKMLETNQANVQKQLWRAKKALQKICEKEGVERG